MQDTAAENLFRRQALESLGRKLPGQPIGQSPRPWAWLTAVVLVSLLAAIVFAVGTQYARKERVQGWLVSDSGIVRILNHETATITRVLIGPGEQVHKGQPLLHVSVDTALPDGSTRVAAVLSQLRAEAAETETQLRLLERTHALQQDGLSGQLAELDGELQALDATLAAQGQRVAMAEVRTRQLGDAMSGGAVARWDLLDEQDEALRLQQELGAQRQRRTAISRERADVRNRLQKLPLQTRLQESQLRSRLWQLAQQITRHESARLTVVRAPASGVVANLSARPGSSIAAGQLLLTILPHDMQLAAEAFVPSRAAAYLQAGQAVRISYDAFPQQKFGVFPAQIALVATDISLPEDIPRALSLNEAAYRIHIAIDRHSIDTPLGSAALRPGMRFAADIILEQQSLADWLLGSLRMQAAIAG